MVQLNQPQSKGYCSSVLTTLLRERKTIKLYTNKTTQKISQVPHSIKNYDTCKELGKEHIETDSSDRADELVQKDKLYQ